MRSWKKAILEKTPDSLLFPRMDYGLVGDFNQIQSFRKLSFAAPYARNMPPFEHPVGNRLIPII